MAPVASVVLDRLLRLGYRGAFQTMRLYWRLAHPETHGALVALWHAGEVLLVQNSYLPFRSLPGGSLRRGEGARAAAVRELREEVGIEARAQDLVQVVDTRLAWAGKLDHVEIFELALAERPRVAIDRREVVAAEFFRPAVALSLHLFPPVRTAIERHRPGPREAREPGRF
jgi:8-oxo-dGTP diphosphatase